MCGEVSNEFEIEFEFENHGFESAANMYESFQ